MDSRGVCTSLQSRNERVEAYGVTDLGLNLRAEMWPNVTRTKRLHAGQVGWNTGREMTVAKPSGDTEETVRGISERY